jgi:hypothetical protein
MLIPEETGYISKRNLGGRFGRKFPQRTLTVAINVVGRNQEGLFLFHRTLGGAQLVT